MDSLPKIAILIPYYGKWPDWMPFFLKSCEHNPDTNWLLVTDLLPVENSPSNVSYISLNLDQLSGRISEKLNVDIRIDNPYKLTDLKPAYGQIFRDLLDGFDFWGYGDLDLIYGNISSFFRPESFSEYDVLSPSEDFFPGHLLLLRNTDKICNLF